ncbi:MAG: YDG domain-containing protein, partial [Candidatus Omnitrophota bacterium]
NATVTLSDDRIAGDVLTAAYTTASFIDKNAGTAKSVSISGISISGIDSANYTVNTTASTTADITARPLTVTAATDTREYNGTTSSTAVPAITVGSLAAGDSAVWTQSFDTKDTGTAKVLTPSGAITDGNAGNNYTVTFINDSTGVITQKALTVSGITADSKVYDGTVNAVINTSTAALAGVVSGETVTLSTLGATGSFIDKNAGLSKTVNISGLSISGADSANYTLTTTSTSTTADITPRALTVTAAGINKVYDGTTNATVTLSDDRIAGDVLTAAYTTASFIDKNAGTAKSVSISGISISGIDSANYTVNTTASTTADIAARPITVSANAGQSKVVGEDDPVFTYTNDPLIAGDTFSGALGRAAGEEIGTYAISQGTLSAGADYSIAFNPALFSIISAVNTEQAVNQISNSINPRPILPDGQQLNQYQVNTYTGAVYFYHPLTEIDMAAFEQFDLTEEDYRFLNGELNIVGHEGILPLLR